MKKLKIPSEKGWSVSLEFESIKTTCHSLSEISFLSRGHNSRDSFCVNCSEKPCYQFSKEEFIVERFLEYPKDTDTSICPTNAILNLEEEGIRINQESCISCGLCFFRCPVGGIKLNEQSGKFIPKEPTSDVLRKQFDGTKNSFPKELIKDTSGINEEQLLAVFLAGTEQLTRFNSVTSEKFVRNILIICRINAIASARGNNHIRFGVLGNLKEKGIAVFEIDLSSKDTLSLNRRLLQGTAMFASSRHGYSINEIHTVAILGEMPRKRSDFYEVIGDISSVLEVKIQAIPVIVLLTYLLRQDYDLMSDIVERAFWSGTISRDYKQHVSNRTLKEPEIEKFIKSIK